MKQVVLYGVSGASNQYRVVRYYLFNEGEISVSEIIVRASMMKEYNPSIERVYAIDNTPDLRRNYLKSIRDKKRPIESAFEFLDTLKRNGLRII